MAYSATAQVGVVKPVRVEKGGTLASFLRSPRFEVLPTEGVADLVATYVPREVTVTVTASPRRGMSATVALCATRCQKGAGSTRIAFRSVGVPARMESNPLSGTFPASSRCTQASPSPSWSSIVQPTASIPPAVE